MGYDLSISSCVEQLSTYDHIPTQTRAAYDRGIILTSQQVVYMGKWEIANLVSSCKHACMYNY